MHTTRLRAFWALGLGSPEILRQHLKILCIDEDGKHNSTEFKSFWRQRLSIELQRCNAQVIIRKLSTANQSRGSSTHTYSNQFYR